MDPQYQPSCKICERGVLVPKKIYRMSGPVVAIGFMKKRVLQCSVCRTTVSASKVSGLPADQFGFTDTTITLRYETQ
jgi:hypothetical protein